MEPIANVFAHLDAHREREAANAAKAEELRAELAILDFYDYTRHIRVDDYGNGQRANELRRRRDELISLTGNADLTYPGLGEFTVEELTAAYERVARPRIRRLERDVAIYGERRRPTHAGLIAWDRTRRAIEAEGA